MTTNTFDAIGHSRVWSSAISPTYASRLAATMGWADEPFLAGDTLPPLWHWLVGAPPVETINLGEDGHERLGKFIPLLPAAKRMWAAGEVSFYRPLRIGVQLDVHSSITDIRQKKGKTGILWFVDVNHDYNQMGKLSLRERQTLVYRDDTKRHGTPSISPEGTPVAYHQLSDTQLFRYSALTFNSHRIHLDRNYCQKTEGSRQLVVHGPLLATIAARAALERLQAPLKKFSFRALSPTFEGEMFSVNVAHQVGDTLRCWITGADRTLKMSCTAVRVNR